MSIQRIALFFIFALAFLFACNDPSTLGLDLVEEDQINIQFRDDVPFRLTTTTARPVETYTPFANAIDGYLCGVLNDPVFGKSDASIYSEFGLDFLLPDFGNPDLLIDSIVLVLPYDTATVYGDTTDLITIEVYEIIEKLNDGQSYFSDQEVMIAPEPIAIQTFLPKPNTDIQFLDYRQGREDTLQSAYLRIPLVNELGQRFLDQDTLIYQSDTSFTQNFHGLHIRTVNTQNTMMGFDLFGLNVNDPGAQGGIYLYYDTLNTDGIPQEYVFPFKPQTRFNPVKFVNFQHDYTDTEVGKNIGDQPANEEVIYVQGMAGVNGQLEFPNFKDLGSIIVNQAKLELTLIDESPNPRFPAAEQLLLFHEKDGKLDYISDFTVAALAIADNLTNAFGGDLEPTAKDSTIQSYTINLSNHFQEMIDGEVEEKIFIQISPKPFRIFTDYENPAATKANRANQIILGSENHSVEQFRAKFTLTYTNIN
ncbi:MAG: DUF4270 family protein [Bacteroidota bacterium]